MPQLRLNHITGERVIIAPHRNERPVDTQQSGNENDPGLDLAHEDLAHHDANCPFCPGNEEDIPPIILEVNTTASPWQTRVIRNKYPAVRSLDEHRTGNGVRKNGISGTPVHGHHEVIIESPRHDVDLADMSVESVVTVLETYHRRYHEIRRLDASLLPILFRNRGALAGASLHHPHSQLIALPLAPARIRQEDDGAAHYYAENGRCAYCDQIEDETAAAVRLVTSNEQFIAFVPYAATGPFEIVIAPRRHEPDFGNVTGSERLGLADILRTAVRSLRATLGRPAYNYVIRSSVEYGSSDPHVHWYLRIVPKLMQPGGFEVATGIPINPSSPEHDAERLRRAI